MTTATNETTVKSDKKTKGHKPEAAGATPALAFATKVAKELKFLPVKSIEFAPFDSRASDKPLTAEFLNDIRDNGVRQSIEVAQMEDGRYMVVAGRRRLRASIEVGHPTIPVLIAPMNERQARISSMNENLHREGLSAWDVATWCHAMRESGMTQTEIAKAIGKSDGYVSQHLSIFDLAPSVQTMVRKNLFEPGTTAKVRELVRIKDPEIQKQIAEDAVSDKENPWTSADIKEAVTRKIAALEARANAAKSRAKRPTKEGEEGGAEEGEDEHIEAPVSKFSTAELAPIKKTEVFRRYLESVDIKLQKLRAEESPDELKIQYEKGRLDAIKALSGLTKLPASIAGE